MTIRSLPLLAALLLLEARASDWPMWRCDAGRTASTGETLPAELRLDWERVYAPRRQAWDDPLNQDLMTYDKVFEPVVMDGRMFLGFNDEDKVVALDLASGAEAWRFYAEGPVRLAPACWRGKVYFSSDDGWLYCLRASDGAKLWSFRGAPAARKALGNGRLISAWPARGGPVIRAGTVYFAASIWPFMGTFLHALDAETGQPVWRNDATGADFIKQPHSAPSFAGVAPQGALVATSGLLLVPGGRSVPAAFDRATGALRYFHLNDGGKGNGGSFVASGEKYFYVHTRERGVRVYDLKTGIGGKSVMNEPVIDGDRLFAADSRAVRELGTSGRVIWEVEADGSGDLIKAGGRLYAAGKGTISAISLGDKPAVVWTIPVDGEVVRLLAAGGKLVAVTLDGRIRVYGNGKPGGRIATPVRRLPEPPAKAVKLARDIFAKLGDPGGHALFFGRGEPGLIDALLSGSQMQLTVVVPDERIVEEMRRRYDDMGLQGRRITIHAGDVESFQAPPYFASLVVAGDGPLRAAYASVRPYGGLLLCPPGPTIDLTGLENARLEKWGDAQTVSRDGPLPGAGDWTHQYGNIGNTVKSEDRLVRAPLGILWFGGNSNADVLPRHGHGPPPQIVGGRLYIQGMNSLSARDVYTGRVLWKHDFADLGTFGIYYNETYADTPLSTKYNQKHIPGANGRGTNFVATTDAIYVAVRGECQVLDPATGQLRQRIPLREKAAGETVDWGFIGALDDLLIGGDGVARGSGWSGFLRKAGALAPEDWSASRGLAVFDRHQGRLLWRAPARHSFLHNGIVAGNGRIYCLDKLTGQAEGILERRGRELPASRIVAFDARSGRVLWEREENIFGTWLGYSAEHDVLLQAGAKATDRLRGEAGEGMIAYRGEDGTVRWQELKRAYSGPCILHHHRILTGSNSYTASAGVFDLLTGEPHLVSNPLTGKREPLRLSRTYGCNTVIASEHLLTFRSGAAGYYDLETLSGTGNLGGFKSGCTSNLIAADGVLNAPDYTRTCSCAYQNQASLALIHMPEMEMWTYSQFGLDGTIGERVHRAGINFGAPGNRRAPDGTLWLEHPHAGTGNAPRLPIEVTGADVRFFRQHSLSVSVAGAGYPWVFASGMAGECEITVRTSLLPPALSKPKSSKDDDEEFGIGSGSPAASAKPGPANPPALAAPSLPHTVRLHFAEPEGLPAGQRVFDVTLQGKKMLENVDVAREGGKAVREFRDILIGRELRLELRAAPGSAAKPVLCGLEFAEVGSVTEQAQRSPLLP